MRAAVVALIVALVGLGSSTTSCFVNRLSERFTCGSAGDCEEGRTCDQGYCVETPCPSPCTDCDLVDKTCRVDCSSNQQCGAVQCPAGFDCTFRCSNGAACGDIDCTAATACSINCSGGDACGTITCGPGECTINCVGAGSCPQIQCGSSCGCDVDCNNSVACPSMSCPQPGGTPCTDNNGRCSTTPNLCDTCP